MFVKGAPAGAARAGRGPIVRRTKEAALATREALIDAAERTFRREGVTRTSLAEIAAEAGVTRGAIYWHFRDKAELLDAMCERTMLPLDAAVARAGEAARADPLGMVRTLAVDALTQLATDGRTQAVFEILFHKCELVGELAQKGASRSTDRDECLSSVRGLFELAIDQGQLPKDADPDLIAHVMHAFVIGLMHEWVRSPEDYDLGAAAPGIVDAFLAGLRASPPRRAQPLTDNARSTTSEPVG
jgi:TetR/AcrR family transcriptional regulator, acrAB operon repressor